MTSITMKQTLELALERAEYVIESARQRPLKRKHSSGGRKSVFQKLYDLYLEESEKEPDIQQKLRRNVNLLEKLVMQETLSCLVVNLYPGNEGYSLMLRGKNGSDSETIRLPYEEGELLDYLDAEELPPILVDLLEKSQVNIFHCGCVIAEIRDYRQSGNIKSPTYQSRHILLRPTMQTLISDVHSITSDNHKWTQEDKLLLESQLILATAEPLCLEPSVSVTCTANQLLYNKQKMNTHPMKRCFKRYCRTALNSQQEVSHCPTPPQLKLLDYLQKRKDRKMTQPHLDLKISKAGNCVDMWKLNPCYLAMPSEIEVEKYVKVEKSIKLDDSPSSVWPAEDTMEDFVFECEAGIPFQRARLSIFQSAGNPQYYGKMQTFKSDEDNGSLISPCQFLIGSRNDIQRVANQYQELFENEAKCPVTMTHNPGGSLISSPLSPGKPSEGENQSGSIQSSLLAKGVKHRPPPVKPPSNPGSTPSGSGTPKPSTPTPTNTPSTTPHPFDCQTSAPVTPCATPTPQDTGFTPQSSLLTTYTQQPVSLSQALPVMTIPLSTVVTSITTGTSSAQVMANPAALNFINVVGSVCGPQTLMSSSNPMLGCNTASSNSAGINLSGGPFGLKNSSGLRPVNLLQLPGASLMYSPLQQQQLSQFSPQVSPSNQQQQEQGLEQGFINQDQAVAAQQGAVLNLASVGSFMPPQAAAAAILAASNGYGSSTNSPATSSPFRQPIKK